MSDESLIEKADTFLPEFHYDLVTRVIPGAVVLMLMLPLKNLESISVSISVVLFVSSYVSGLILDAFSHFLIDGLFSPLLNLCNIITIKKLWDETLQTTPTKRRLMLKVIAERNLFRSLLLFSVAYLWWPSHNILGEISLEEIKIFIPFILLICFIRFHAIASENLKSFNVLPESQ